MTLQVAAEVSQLDAKVTGPCWLGRGYRCDAFSALLIQLCCAHLPACVVLRLTPQPASDESVSFLAVGEIRWCLCNSFFCLLAPHSQVHRSQLALWHVCSSSAEHTPRHHSSAHTSPRVTVCSAVFTSCQVPWPDRPPFPYRSLPPQKKSTAALRTPNTSTRARRERRQSTGAGAQRLAQKVYMQSISSSQEHTEES